MKFEIKNHWDGKLIFSIETDSWKLAMEAAIKAKANLRSADLSSANLRSADLSSANLSYADLSYADLRSADLSYANLRSADLSYADLSSANLRSADLSSADLSSAKTDHRFISVSGIGSLKRMTIYDLTDDKIFCGCFIGTLEEFEKQVQKTHAEKQQYLAEYMGFIQYVRGLK